MTDRAIFRYEVEVGGLTISREYGDPIAVGCRDVNVVEWWALNDSSDGSKRAFTAVGTGHPLPDNFIRHWGTAVAPGGQLVWHLIEVKYW